MDHSFISDKISDKILQKAEEIEKERKDCWKLRMNIKTNEDLQLFFETYRRLNNKIKAFQTELTKANIHCGVDYGLNSVVFDACVLDLDAIFLKYDEARGAIYAVTPYNRGNKYAITPWKWSKEDSPFGNVNNGWVMYLPINRISQNVLDDALDILLTEDGDFSYQEHWLYVDVKSVENLIDLYEEEKTLVYTDEKRTVFSLFYEKMYSYLSDEKIAKEPDDLYFSAKRIHVKRQNNSFLMDIDAFYKDTGEKAGFVIITVLHNEYLQKDWDLNFSEIAQIFLDNNIGLYFIAGSKDIYYTHSEQFYRCFKEVVQQLLNQNFELEGYKRDVYSNQYGAWRLLFERNEKLY